MNRFKDLLDLVEIRTKVASIFPFLVGSLYAFVHFESFVPLNAVIMFFSLLMIDMATTTGNHYMDHKKAILKEGYNYEVHNPIAKRLESAKFAKGLVIVLVVLGAMLGLVLAYRTDLLVLIVGAVSFLFGLLYSFGPLPISRTPAGEAVSGLFMGMIIVFLSVYIHVLPLHLIGFAYDEQTLLVMLSWRELVDIAIVGLPMMFLISNIMLANNICDMEEDVINQRVTLPILLGEAQSTKLYIWVVYLTYASVMIGIVIGALPLFEIIVLSTFPILNKQTWLFVEKPLKSETFILSVKNFVLFSSIYCLGFVLEYIAQWL